MACPAPEARHPGLGAVGTPHIGRGVETMETKMTKKPRRSLKSVTTPGTKAKAAGPRRRPSARTKKQIALVSDKIENGPRRYRIEAVAV